MMHAEGPASAVQADLDGGSVDLDVGPSGASTGEEPTAKAKSPATAKQPPVWSVLRHKHFRTVWTAAFFSNAGNWMEFTGVHVLVATQTKDIKMSAYVGIAATAPILLLGLFGGLVADRVDRKKLLLVTQVLMMLIAVGMTIVSRIDWTAWGPNTLSWAIITLTAINGTVMAFNMPAWQVLVPRLVPKDELVRAITLNGIQFNMSRIVGPLLAGVILVSGDVSWLFAINALSFLVVALAVSTTPAAPPTSNDLSRPWAQIGAALKFLITSRGPRAVFLAIIICSALAAPLMRLLSQFCIDVYAKAKDDVEIATTLLMAILGVGAVIGGLCVRYIPAWYPRHHFIPMSVSGLGFCMCAFALCRAEWAGYLITLPMGVFWVWSFNQTWAAAQSLVPDDMRGRAMAVASVASFGSTGVGLLLAGSIGDFLSKHRVLGHDFSKSEATQAAVLALAATLFCAGLVMLTFRTPEVDGMPRKAAGRPPSKNPIKALIAFEHHPARKAARSETDTR